jgi:glycosyltransferase involved in cell wall biosynthesis
MKTPKISIIIPVYNIENYIIECLESVLAQTYTDYEVIIVNDGSTDNSVQVISNFIEEKNLDNFVLLSKENGGPASTRNFAMQYAKGDWFAFVDGDDWLEPQYLEVMWNVLERYDADLCYTGTRAFDESKKEFVPWASFLEEFGSMPGDIAKLQSFGTVWAHLYKREIIKKYNILFDENIYCEDCAFNLDYNSVISSFCTTSDIVYNYRINRGGQLTAKFVYPSQKARLFNHMQTFLASVATENIIKEIPKNNRLCRVMWNELYTSITNDILEKKYDNAKKRRKEKLTKVILSSYKPRSKKEKIMSFCLKNSYILLRIVVKIYYSKYEKLRKTKALGYFSKYN